MRSRSRAFDYGFPATGQRHRRAVACPYGPDAQEFLFAGSGAGGERAAVAYTILGSCRLAGVDPREHLADVLPRQDDRLTIRIPTSLYQAIKRTAVEHNRSVFDWIVVTVQAGVAQRDERAKLECAFGEAARQLVPLERP